jgi:hypothetical protein
MDQKYQTKLYNGTVNLIIIIIIYIYIAFHVLSFIGISLDFQDALFRNIFYSIFIFFIWR